MQGDFVLLLPVLLPMLAGLAVFLMKPDSARTRNALVGATLVVNALLTLFVLLRPESTLVIWSLTKDLPIALNADRIAKLFAGLISFVWALVGFYAFEYMRHEENERRFFGFYLISLGVLIGLSLSDNLVTFYMFYELMTLMTLPLVLHTMKKDAVAAGIKYLIYSVAGAAMVLCGLFFLYSSAGTLTFAPGGVLDLEALAQSADGGATLRAMVFLMIVGFGVKAGMFPMHGWLPTAHPVAPAPASAVLSGVITKAGVLGILRVVYELAGVQFLRGTWVQYAFMTLALITVFMGSMLAWGEKVLKKRLAYSTVSQVSYVLFGLSTMTEAGFLGALLHVVFHSLIKNGLFLSAGAIIVKTGKTKVEELRGIGKRMPVTMWCYTLASVALVGIPPACGFVSKWYLAGGALALPISANWIGPAVLLASAILTAAYLLPITIQGFFPGPEYEEVRYGKCEPSPWMTVPLCVLAALCLLLGMFPNPLISLIESIMPGLL